MLSQKLVLSAAGAGADTVYVDDVFSTFLYDGDGTTSQTIANGIDLSGEGGMVWIKNRDYEHHNLFDTHRGTGLAIESSNNREQRAPGNTLTAFNSNGFTVSNNNTVGASGKEYCAWTFRKKPGFFDIVTFTANNSSSGVTVSHNLGSTPGSIWVKAYNIGSNDWWVWHRSGPVDSSPPSGVPSGSLTGGRLNTGGSFNASSNIINTVTSTSFKYGTNGSGYNDDTTTTYVAYIFAHQPNTSFVEEVYVQDYYASGSNITGPNGSGEYRFYYNSSTNVSYANVGPNSYQVSGQNKWDELSDVIFAALAQRYRVGNLQQGGNPAFYSMEYFTGYTGSTYDDEDVYSVCGGYRGNATSSNEIVLGFEPQWVLIKTTSGSKDWMMFDNMRGIVNGENDSLLEANKNDAEFATKSLMALTPTGFKLTSSDGDVNGSDDSYIYIAIRRPNKPPEAATDVFAIDNKSAASANTPQYTSNFPVDFLLNRFNVHATGGPSFRNRHANEYIQTNEATARIADSSNMTKFNYNNGYGDLTSSDSNDYVYMFRRAPEFADLVFYDGDGNTSRSINHNLGVAPELVIIKNRFNTSSGSSYWTVHSTQITASQYLRLDENQAVGVAGVDSYPTATTFPVTKSTSVYYSLNKSGDSYVAYLFASIAGICKIGKYTGAGGSTDVDVDCGFTNGARFVIIKKTNQVGDWNVFDTSRGINSGTEKYFTLNQSFAPYEFDVIDPLSSGFRVVNENSASQGFNVSGHTYLFFAIA
jgi:hypothetical protein